MILEGEIQTEGDTPPALSSLDIEEGTKIKAEARDATLEASELSRKRRASIFDALENSAYLLYEVDDFKSRRKFLVAPTSSSKRVLPNIVTSWETTLRRSNSTQSFKAKMIPEFKVPMVPAKASRHIRTMSSTASCTVAQSPTDVPSNTAPSKLRLSTISAGPRKGEQVQARLTVTNENEKEYPMSAYLPSQAAAIPVKDVPKSRGSALDTQTTGLRRTKMTIATSRPPTVQSSNVDIAKARPRSAISAKLCDPKPVSRGVSRRPSTLTSRVSFISSAAVDPTASKTGLRRSSSLAGTSSNGLQKTSSRVIPPRKTANSGEAKSSTVAPPRNQTCATTSTALKPIPLTEKNLEEETGRQKVSASSSVAKNKPKEERLRRWAAGVASAVDLESRPKENVPAVPEAAKKYQLTDQSVKTSATLDKRVSQCSVRSAVPTSDAPKVALLRSRPSLNGLRLGPKTMTADVLPLSSQTNMVAKLDTKLQNGVRARPSLYNMRAGITSAPALPESTRSQVLSNPAPSGRTIDLRSSALTAAKPLPRASSLLSRITRSKKP